MYFFSEKELYVEISEISLKSLKIIPITTIYLNKTQLFY